MTSLNADRELDTLLQLGRMAHPDPLVHEEAYRITHRPHSLSGTGMGIVYNIREEHGTEFVEVPWTLVSLLEVDSYRVAFELWRDAAGVTYHPILLVQEYEWCVLTVSAQEWMTALRSSWTAKEMRERLEITESYADHCRRQYARQVRNHQSWRDTYPHDGYAHQSLNPYEEARARPLAID